MQKVDQLAYVQNQYVAPVYELINSLTPLMKNFETNKTLDKNLLESFYQRLDNCPPPLLDNSSVNYYLQKELLPLFAKSVTESSSEELRKVLFFNKLYNYNLGVYIQYIETLVKKCPFLTENETNMLGKLTKNVYWSIFDPDEFIGRAVFNILPHQQSSLETYYENIIQASAKKWGEQLKYGFCNLEGLHGKVTLKLPTQTETWPVIFNALKTKIPGTDKPFLISLNGFFLDADQFEKYAPDKQQKTVELLANFLNDIMPMYEEGRNLSISDKFLTPIKLFQDKLEKSDLSKKSVWKVVSNFDFIFYIEKITL